MWDIRRASLADRRALVDLCTAAVGPDDYPIEVMDDLILRGVFHVALDGPRIVGALRYTDAVDGSGWLGVARTHPDYRRQGVNGALIESFAGLARRTRVPALRLWSAAANVEGTASARGAGFREVARFTRLSADAPSSRGGAAPALVPFGETAWDEATASDAVRKGRGYVPYESYFVPLTRANFHLLCNRRALRRMETAVVAFSDNNEEDDGGIEFSLISGPIEDLFRRLPAAARATGFGRVRGFVPHDPEILAAADRAGFRPAPWGHEAVLYERAIDVAPASYRKRRTYAEIAADKRGGYAAMAKLAGGGHGHTGPHEDRWNG